MRTFLDKSDLIFGIGCSFTETNFGVKMPAGAKASSRRRSTPADINKDVPVCARHRRRRQDRARGTARRGAGSSTAARRRITKKVAAEIKDDATSPGSPSGCRSSLSNDAPLNPYRVLWDLQNTVDIANTIITHDAGSPRDQLSPFWKSTTPLSYIGWGKTTQLGAGLGFAMGAKLAKPDKLCINVWGDAAIGFTGMDFETAVRERIPILSILLNNFSMAIELKVMPVSTEKYRSTDISGDYAAMARAFGGLRRARREAGRHRAGDQARHRRDPERPARAARVHHVEGDRKSAASADFAWASPILHRLAPYAQGAEPELQNEAIRQHSQKAAYVNPNFSPDNLRATYNSPQGGVPFAILEWPRV